MMEYADHIYRSADDRLNLYARIYDGNGPALLMMHGLTRSSADFGALAEQFSGRFRLVVPDQRGRGRSDYEPKTVNYTPATYVGDMFALLDDLQISKVTLIGTSMGGLMAMMIAAMAPERVTGMILNDIGPKVDQAGLDRIQSYVGEVAPFANWDDAANHCKKINNDALPDFDNDNWLKFAHRTCIQMPDGRIKFAYDPAISEGLSGDDPSAVPTDLWPMWDLLTTIPALVIRGAHSDILSEETVKEMGSRHSADFTAVDIPQRGHAPMLDEPDALQAIEAFLTGLRA